VTWIALWFGCTTLVSAQSPSGGFLPSGEAICGYSGSYFALEADQAKQGLSVQLLAGEAEAARPVPLRFRVSQMPHGLPVDDLQVEHEKLMHVIGVREDLGEFIHLHPRRAAPGIWQIIHVFTNPGRYQFWSDVKHRGTVYSFAHPRFTVAGDVRSEPRGEIPRLRDFKCGYEVALQSTAPVLVAGQTNLFEVVVREESGPQVGTEFFLGALMHLVIVREDLSVYRHAHAREHWRSGLTTTFEHVFPIPGRYKIFAQFRPHKTKLPPDQAILADFWVRVVGR
jgi:hypothetical protein